MAEPEDEAPGVPEWVVTYGDMMSLLLTFFIMLVSMSELKEELIRTAKGTAECSLQDLRVKSNSLALRSTQAALAAAKGSGYVEGHPAGRWCQEALFFLVWSCPQPVLNANLCELAGIQE